MNNLPLGNVDFEALKRFNFAPARLKAPMLARTANSHHLAKPSVQGSSSLGNGIDPATALAASLDEYDMAPELEKPALQDMIFQQIIAYRASRKQNDEDPLGRRIATYNNKLARLKKSPGRSKRK